MSAETRYYYVDAQNQAAGPISMTGLLALRAAGTVADATLVVTEGGTEWVAFSTLKPAAVSPTPATAPTTSPQSAASPEALRSSVPATSGVRGEGGSSSFSTTAEPLWASQLSQKISQLSEAMDKLAVALDKSRPALAPAAVPATAALHAEKINLNATPKPGIAALNPAGPTPAAPRPGVGTTLSPLAVPANAQKSPLPLPALGKAPGPSPASATAKGNIFSKFLKK